MSTSNRIDLRVETNEIFSGAMESENSFLCLAKDTSWDDDRDPPDPDSSYREFYEFYDSMLHQERILFSDVRRLINRESWMSGSVYDIYRHDYSVNNRSYSNSNSLLTSRYYVINSQNNVYICLNNNSNSESRIEPLDGDSNPFRTADGYQWLRLFSVSMVDMKNYSTPHFIPISEYLGISHTQGAVFTVIIDNPGNGYTNNPVGASTLRYYYCSILGDGTNGVARVKIDGGQVVEVDVVDYGQGYTTATLDFTPNNCYRSVDDLRNKIAPLDPQGDGTLVATVMIQPPGGWGTDIPRELCSHRMGVFKEILTSPSVEYDFRQIGIIEDGQTDSGDVLIEDTGKLIYLSNASPISRTFREKIRISLMISF